MNRETSLSLLMLVIAIAALLLPVWLPHVHRLPVPAPVPAPVQPAPVKPRPLCPRCPHCGQELPGWLEAEAGREPVLGGLASPDGLTQAVLYDYDGSWPKNISSGGFGCCAFRALSYAARLQAVPALIGLPERMKEDGVPGGGYPAKMDTIVQRYGGGASYFQDTDKDFVVLAALLKSKRLPCVDYSGRDPHYNQRIAHCVNICAYDDVNDWVGILDNNYPQSDQIVWMGKKQFASRWNGWLYGLLAATPGTVVPVGETGGENDMPKNDAAIDYSPIPGAPGQYQAIKDGKQIGVWLKPKQEYWPLNGDGTFAAEPAVAPSEPPGALHFPGRRIKGVLNFGLDTKELNGAEMSSIDGKPAGKKQLLAAIGPEMVPAVKPSGGADSWTGIAAKLESLPLMFWILVVAIVLLLCGRRRG